MRLKTGGLLTVSGAFSFFVFCFAFVMSVGVAHASGYTYAGQFGGSGSGNGQFSVPYRIAIASSTGNIYVTDYYNKRVEIFNSSGVYQSEIGGPGGCTGDFGNPSGIAISPLNGDVYVADSNNNCVEIFNSSGVFQSEFGGSGSSTGEFSGPNGVAVDSSGNIYVVDSGNDRVEVFNSSGVYQSQFGSSGSGNGQLNNPYGITIDSSGKIYVADYSNDRVDIFNSSGVYQSEIGGGGSGNGQFSGPTDIAVDSSGNIYVTDLFNYRVQIFNSSGVYQSQFGSQGAGNGEFDGTDGLALDSSGNIFVADRSNYVEEFSSNISPAVITLPALSVGTSTITLDATVSSSSSPVTQSGFAYGTSSSLTSDVSTTTLGSQGAGTFSENITGLTPNTTYYFEAYVVNSDGTSTGSTMSTTTNPGPGLYYTFNGAGLQTLTYNGQSYITEPSQESANEVNATFLTPGSVENNYNGSVFSSVISTSSNYFQQVYNSGQSDSYTVKTQYSTPEPNTLETDIYITNNDATDTLQEVNIKNLNLLTPGYTPYNSYWPDSSANIGIGPVSIGNDYYPPGPLTFLSGNWGSFAIDSDNYTGNWTFGSTAGFAAGAGSSTQFVMSFSNFGDNGGNDASNTLMDLITPGQTRHYMYDITFGSASDTPATLGSTGYASWRNSIPYLINWPNRAPIGRWFIASGADDSVTNPRGYLGSSTLDVSSSTVFDAAIMTAASTTIAAMNAMNPKPQAVLIWDLEGQEFNQPFTYVGNPNELNTISPEMGAVADQLISTIQNAGYQVGLTLRPSNFGAGPTLPATCYHDTNTNNGPNQDSDVFVLTTASYPYRGYECTATNTWTQPGANLPNHQTGSDDDSVLLSNLQSKVTYAQNRWGIHLFYVDSTIYGDAGTGFSYLIWRQLQTEFPDDLFIPEQPDGPPAYAATAPYTAPGDTVSGLSTPQASLDLYPNAFSVIQAVDSGGIDLTTNSTDYNTLVQSVEAGNILFFDGWYESTQNAQIASIYQDAYALAGLTVPTLTTTTASNITMTSATLNGAITADGGASSTVEGFNYGTTMSYGLIASSSGIFGVGSFNAAVTGLTCNTTYHFQAYADNSAGIGTSTDQTFNTSTCSGSTTAPTVSTSAATSVSTSSIIFNGAITATGGANALQSGFVYGTSSSLTSVIATTTLGAQTGTATLNQTLSGLIANTTYYFEAYATNSAGTSFGSILSTTTLANASSTAATVSTNVATNIASSSATLNGAIVSTGGASTTQSGFAFGTSSSLTGSGVTISGLGSQTGDASFLQNLTGLSPYSTYYFRAYAVNANGTSTGSILSFITLSTAPTVTTQAPTANSGSAFTANGTLSATGGQNASIEGFAYGTTTAYGATTTSSGSFGTGTLSQAISGLLCSTTYHVVAYAANSGGTSYGGDQTVTTQSCTVPAVSVSSASNVGQTFATLNGSIASDGNASSTLEGFVWGTSSSYGATTTSTGTYGNGSFSQNLSSLSCDTTYDFGALAQNPAGFGTSTNDSFTTSACPVAVSSGGGAAISYGGGGGGSVSSAELATLLAPSASTTTYLNSLPTTASVTAVSPTFTSTLALGSTGPQVTALQTLLANLGFFKVVATGYYGSVTEAAVKAYQASNGISPVGSVGPLTRASLNAQTSSRTTTAVSTTASSSAVTYDFTRSLGIGSIGLAVKALQGFLNTNGFTVTTSGPGSPGNETSYFGPATQNVVARFQKYHGIVPDSGYFGPITRGVVNGV
jgi:peptidoglycan hydrolase-like protein with peptidoglycan-binding domain/sugar lactone lactonase YvrE